MIDIRRDYGIIRILLIGPFGTVGAYDSDGQQIPEVQGDIVDLLTELRELKAARESGTREVAKDETCNHYLRGNPGPDN